MSSRSATARITECEILNKQYKGIKIPKSAIHFENGEIGVYVNFSNIAQFKKINPIFEDSNYVIVDVYKRQCLLSMAGIKSGTYKKSILPMMQNNFLFQDFAAKSEKKYSLFFWMTK